MIADRFMMAMVGALDQFRTGGCAHRHDAQHPQQVSFRAGRSRKGRGFKSWKGGWLIHVNGSSMDF